VHPEEVCRHTPALTGDTRVRPPAPTDCSPAWSPRRRCPAGTAASDRLAPHPCALPRGELLQNPCFLPSSTSWPDALLSTALPEPQGQLGQGCKRQPSPSPSCSNGRQGHPKSKGFARFTVRSPPQEQGPLLRGRRSPPTAGCRPVLPLPRQRVSAGTGAGARAQLVPAAAYLT